MGDRKVQMKVKTAALAHPSWDYTFINSSEGFSSISFQTIHLFWLHPAQARKKHARGIAMLTIVQMFIGAKYRCIFVVLQSVVLMNLASTEIYK